MDKQKQMKQNANKLMAFYNEEKGYYYILANKGLASCARAKEVETITLRLIYQKNL